MLSTLAQINPIVTNILVVLFLIVCVLMILTVLIQRPMGGGLAGAFGSGAGSGQTAFGTKTGDALTIATITMFVIYLGFAIGLNFAVGTAATPRSQGSQTPAPTTTAPAGATTPGDNKPADGAPAETKPAETKPAETKPGESAAPGGGAAQPAPVPAAPAGEAPKPAGGTTQPATPAAPK